MVLILFWQLTHHIQGYSRLIDSCGDDGYLVHGQLQAVQGRVVAFAMAVRNIARQTLEAAPTLAQGEHLHHCQGLLHHKEGEAEVIKSLNSCKRSVHVDYGVCKLHVGENKTKDMVKVVKLPKQYCSTNSRLRNHCQSRGSR